MKIGSVIIEAKDLCRPCKHLQEMIARDDIVKKFIFKGGLRCKIISSGKIHKGDQISINL